MFFFARRQLEASASNPALLGNLLFTNEANFYLNGKVNQWDFRLWSNEKPHWFAEKPLHLQKVTVWVLEEWLALIFGIRKVLMKKVLQLPRNDGELIPRNDGEPSDASFENVAKFCQSCFSTR